MKRKVETAVTIIVAIIAVLPELLTYLPHKKKYYSYRTDKKK